MNEQRETKTETTQDPSGSALKIRAVTPSGEAKDLEIRPDPTGDGTGEELTDLLLEALGIEEVEPDGPDEAPRRNRSRSWKLRNVTRGRFIDPSQPLSRDDLQPGDTVEVVGTMVAGGAAR